MRPFLKFGPNRTREECLEPWPLYNTYFNVQKPLSYRRGAAHHARNLAPSFGSDGAAAGEALDA